MPKTERLWTKLDIGYFGNPKVVEVLYAEDGGDETRAHAVLMHLASICHARQHGTRGFVSERAIARQIGGTGEDGELLVSAGLWHRSGHDCEKCPEVPEGKVYVHDYDTYSPWDSGAQARSEKATRAAQARWSNAQASDEHENMPQAMLEHEVSIETSNAQAMLDDAKTRQDKTRQDKKTRAVRADSAFDAFWDAYPSKVGKLAARKAYEKALTLTTAEHILAAVKAYALRADPKYIANPATWLNHGRWDDEPIVERVEQRQRPWAYQPIPEQTPEQQQANQEWLMQRRAEELAKRGEPDEYFEADQLPGFDWQGVQQ